MQKEIEPLRQVVVTRYISPLREGGSLPGLIEADDGFKYVLKFRGAGHGVKALIAELLGGLIAQFMGLKVPELVLASLDKDFGRTEADEEIQDLLKWSLGLNLGLHFLSGAINYDPAVMSVDPKLASKIVWLDAFITNIDRSFRNTNMLMWHRELWLIDHGASFYFHHSWEQWEEKAISRFPLIKDHVLLKAASELETTNEEMKGIFTPEILRQITDQLPSDWLKWESTSLAAEDLRDVYYQFLRLRLESADAFTKEAQDARERLI